MSLEELLRSRIIRRTRPNRRLAVRAIVKSEETGSSPILSYQDLMKRVVRKLEENAKRQAARYETNETLEKSFSAINMIKSGPFMMVAAQVNKILPSQSLILLPP